MIAVHHEQLGFRLQIGGPALRRRAIRKSANWLCVEELEPRLTLTGSIRAALADHVLSLTGSPGSDLVTIEQNGPVGNEPELIEIRGMGGTKVNGGSKAIFPAEASTRLELNLGSGNNAVQIGSGPGASLILDGLIAIMGNGNDLLAIIHCTLNGPVTVSTGAGTDRVTIEKCEFMNTVTYVLGAGNDVLSIDDSKYCGFTTVDLGAGNDKLLVETRRELHGQSEYDGYAIRCGKGNDLIRVGIQDDPGRRITVDGPINVDGGPGTDSIQAATNNAFNQSYRDRVISNFERLPWFIVASQFAE